LLWVFRSLGNRINPLSQPRMRRVTALEAFCQNQLLSSHRLPFSDFSAALETKRIVNREALSKAVLEYVQSLGAPKAVLENAKLLAHPESLTIMTGQQAGLLLGASYTISKAVDAILLAKRYSSAERPVLPVFWVASQDHDAEEVRHAFFLDLSEVEHHISLDLPKGVPIGAIALEPQFLETVLQHLRNFDAPEVFKTPLLEMLEKTFVESKNYAEWFSRILMVLLGQYGLLIVDPLFPSIAALFATGFEQELESPLASSVVIEEAALQLEAFGVTAQLRRGEHATNLFLTGLDGQRRLLKFNGSEFLAERTYSKTELLGILKTSPWRLTPAAGLRSILADSVFPSVVNVLGPGELAYHLQLLEVYKLHDVPQPLMSPRLSLTIIEPPVKRILEKHHLTAREFQQGRGEQLRLQLFETHQAKTRILSTLEQNMQQIESLSNDLTQLETGFSKSVWRMQAAMRYQLEHKLPKKLQAALLRTDTDLQSQLLRLEKHLLPSGMPQERHNSFLEYILKFGSVALERVLTLEPSGVFELEI
jgi:bacillithiol synthase